MPNTTDNHAFGRPIEGGDTDDWGRVLNEDLIDSLDVKVWLRDAEANRTNYTAYTDALFLSTDTGVVYIGNGTTWDELDLDVAAHATTHENGGSDEISVEGLSGDLADAQDPKTHASTHAKGASDDLAGNTIAPDAVDTDEVQNQDYNEAVNTQTAQTGAVTIDLSVANYHEVEADGDITLSFSNVSSSPPGNSLVIYLFDGDTTGPHTVTWPASVVWSGGTVEDTIPSDGDIEISLLSPDGGSTWRARLSGEAFA